MSIVFIGLQGVGKSSLGKKLAAQLLKPFIDTDLQLLATSGYDDCRSMAQALGEQAFRTAENRCLASLQIPNNALIATGGGVVLSAENKAIIKPWGTVVYLYHNALSAYQRLCHLAVRPPFFQQWPNEEQFKDYFNSRDDLYRAWADIIIDLSDLSEQQAMALLQTELHSLKEL